MLVSDDPEIIKTLDDKYECFHWSNLQPMWGRENQGKGGDFNLETFRYKWMGIELSLELSSSIRMSVFHGSQKGGLVCANGLCAVQPSFMDGTKVTIRALF